MWVYGVIIECKLKNCYFWCIDIFVKWDDVVCDNIEIFCDNVYFFYGGVDGGKEFFVWIFLLFIVYGSVFGCVDSLVVGKFFKVVDLEFVVKFECMLYFVCLLWVVIFCYCFLVIEGVFL